MINEHDLKDWDYLEVKKITENPDGSAKCEVDMGPNAVKYLLSFAFVNLLRSGIESVVIYED